MGQNSRIFGVMLPILLLALSRPVSEQKLEHTLTLSFVNGSLCLDGSMAGYLSDIELYEKCDLLVVELEGGGLCFTQSSCKERTTNWLGSSKYWSSSMSASGFTDSDCQVNPDFCSGCHVFLPYCSSDVWLGDSDGKDPDWNEFYFHGHRNLDVIMNHMFNAYESKFSNLSNVLLLGESAGGYGTWLNLDWFSDTIKQRFGSHVQVKGAPIAGWFMPGETAAEIADGGLCPDYVDNYDHFIENKHQSSYCNNLLEHLYQPDALIDTKCYADHPGKEYSCYTAHVGYHYIDTPIFFAQNQFDNEQIIDQLGCPSTQPWTDLQKEFIAYFGTAMAESIDQVNSTKGDGLFLLSCFLHTEGLESFTLQNVTFVEAVGDWFWNRNKLPHRLIDNCQSPNGLPCGQCSKP
eukprot:c7795_g1_i1.p1 GENE.c7795_g1_i1~~c7795_g1_i1.p1  ORF type:complete len:405 (-),score=85.35 c7795_g1_i1:44-1258(-)